MIRNLCIRSAAAKAPRLLTFAVAVALLVAPAIVARADSDEDHSSANPKAVGAVYTMSNSSSGNEIYIFNRFADGTLAAAGVVSTGGMGNNSYLQSQGAVILDGERKFVLAVNPGDSTLSVLRIRRSEESQQRLVLTDVVPSGGRTPVSVAEADGIVFVAHADSANISGFWLRESGKLRPIPGSVQALSTPTSSAAQIVFGDEEKALLVTEKNSNNIAVYSLEDDGKQVSLTFVEELHPGDETPTPYGIAVAPNGLVLTAKAAAGAPSASVVGIHLLSVTSDMATLLPLAQEEAPTGHTMATAILYLRRSARFAYVANSGDDTITAFAIRETPSDSEMNESASPEMSLVRQAADGNSAKTGSEPVALAASRNRQFLYTLNIGDRTFSIFRIERNGSLSWIADAPGVPSAANGLAAY